MLFRQAELWSSFHCWFLGEGASRRHPHTADSAGLCWHG